MFEIKQITAQGTVALRHRILRPQQTAADCLYPGDDNRESFHIGAYTEDLLISIASFFPQSTERLAQGKQYRLRGMGTLDEYRGQGAGAAVLKEGEPMAKKKGYDLIWCNARTTASGYYTKQGYTPFEDIFEIEGIGPHKVMYKVF